MEILYKVSLADEFSPQIDQLLVIFEQVVCRTSHNGAGTRAAVEEDDDPLGGEGDAGVEVRGGAVGKRRARREKMPTAQVLLRDEAGGGGEAVRLEAV